MSFLDIITLGLLVNLVLFIILAVFDILFFSWPRHKETTAKILLALHAFASAAAPYKTKMHWRTFMSLLLPFAYLLEAYHTINTLLRCSFDPLLYIDVLRHELEIRYISKKD